MVRLIGDSYCSIVPSGYGFKVCLLLLLAVDAQQASSSTSERTSTPQPSSGSELRHKKAYRSMRRVLVGDEERQFVELSLEFDMPIYSRVCQRHDAVFVAAANKCLLCPDGCILSSLFAGTPSVPGLVIDGRADCMCGLSYEEIQLRSRGWPGDPGFADVVRVQPIEYPSPLEPPRHLEAYGTAVWQTDSLMVDLKCPGRQWPAVAHSGLNGLPVQNSLWWLQRFETAYGLEDIDTLLANASQAYNDKMVTFLLPVNWTRHGTVRQLGPSMEELLSCSLEFPMLSGFKGEPVATIDLVSNIPLLQRPCGRRALAVLREQVNAVLRRVPDAAKQPVRCREAWLTSYSPGMNWKNTADLWGPAERPLPKGRLRRTGALFSRNDFHPDETVRCTTLRKQLRLRAYNMMQRVLSYTATDAANGCWDLMEQAVTFTTRTDWAVTDQCTRSPTEAQYWWDPCCSMQMRRVQCCAIRNTSIEQPVASAVNATLLGELVHADLTGGALYGRRVAMTALSWKRRLTEDAGTSACQKHLATQEQAHIDSWRTLERCHAEIMGRYDRELRMYTGLPCIVNQDCFTECVKPQLPPLRRYTRLLKSSQQKHQLVGRCRVPTTQRHVYLMKCLVERGGEEVREFLAQELGLSPTARKESDIVDTLSSSSAHKTDVCIGPYAARAVAYTQQKCLMKQACNWNHEIQLKADCEAVAFGNDEFCGCAEGHCPQLSLKSGCRTGRVSYEECNQARAVLREHREFECTAQARSSKDMERCSVLINFHDFLMRRCYAKRCQPPTEYAMVDDFCYDAFRQEFASCQDQCNIPSGPNPLINRKVCYIELGPNETAEDCYKAAGDAEVHYKPNKWRLTLDVNHVEKAKYCSIRLWNQLQDIRPARSRYSEAQAMYNAEVRQKEEAATQQRTLEKAVYDARVEHMKNPVAEADCDYGALSVDSSTKAECRARKAGCCLSPRNASVAYCDSCLYANTTICIPGDRIMARWDPNKRFYGGKINTDLGYDDKLLVDWDDNSPYFREVQWPSVFTRNGVACVAESEGCMSHHQCRADQYCMSCEKCRIEYGGNPPKHLCAPCPTYRGGACRPRDECETLQSSMNGNCTFPDEMKKCPCKSEWTVSGQYLGAPTDNGIQGCWFDQSQGKRWCEVDKTDNCKAEMRVGINYFIYWNECEPDSCAYCQCDCSERCIARDILPVAGMPQYMSKLNRSWAGEISTNPLPSHWTAWSGRIAPNCSDNGHARVRELCSFCVTCCADLCHRIALGVPSDANATVVKQAEKDPRRPQSWDCTATNVSGCINVPTGWADSIGRSCEYYRENELCTYGGLYGINWPTTPPTTFFTYVSNGMTATDVCCDCGGGQDCVNVPVDWEDASGHTCETYSALSWCKRGGYGHGWNASWGVFPLGTQGIDALAACCDCGGGKPMQESNLQKLYLIESFADCRRVWPGRAEWQPAPWEDKQVHYCRMLNGICQRKLQATTYDPAIGMGAPDNPRLWGLCEQRNFITGLYKELEDFEVAFGLGGRRLEEDEKDVARRLYTFYHRGRRDLTDLAKSVQPNGSMYALDFFGNMGRGMCYMRLPDPMFVFGGPRREVMPEPWLAPHKDAETPDVFTAPGLKVLGWPLEMWPALPYIEGDVSFQDLLDAITGDNDGGDITGILRDLLAKLDVHLLPQSLFDERAEWWWNAYDSSVCAGEIREFLLYKMDRGWQAGIYDSERECVEKYCSIDAFPNSNETFCVANRGCSKMCTYCSSTALMTEPQGLCYTEEPAQVANCGSLGGVLQSGEMYDEILGVRRSSTVCAFPHRPLMYCTEQGDKIKRCITFEEEYCETDPLAKLMRCRLDIRPCPSAKECDLVGQCSDRDAGLSWSLPDTCVMTPLIDTLVDQRCDAASGLCFFRLDPPIGMEVRKLHDMLDFLEPDDTQDEDPDLSMGDLEGIGATFQAAEDEEQLRTAGRLNKTECEILGRLAPPGHTTIFLERARTGWECERWQGCCLAFLGDRCSLFSGPVVDRYNKWVDLEAKQKECDLCGGNWINVFEWELGTGWERGTMRKSGRKWLPRKFQSANSWAEVVDMGAMREKLENALQTRLGKHRQNALYCQVDPLLVALETMAAAVEAPESNPLLPNEFPTMPPIEIQLGSTVAVGGLVSHANLGSVELAWHDFTSTDGDLGIVNVEYSLTLEPFEFSLASAATQLALPGRAELARSRLLRHVLAPEMTTTPLPPSREIKQVGAQGGYPPWMINQMLELEGSETLDAEEQARSAALIKDEAERKRIRLEMEAAAREAANAASGLPQTSMDLLLNKETERSEDQNMFVTDMFNDSCRSVVTSPGGEVFGQLLGDCVGLKSSKDLVNSVVMCVPLRFSGWELNETEVGRYSGIVFDFATKHRVPTNYTTVLPPEIPAAAGEIPGEVAAALWNWGTHPEYGRMKPGSDIFTPQNLVTWKRKDDTELCAQVVKSGAVYCPIARLNSSFYEKLPRIPDAPEFPSPDSTCPALDSILMPIQEEHVSLERTGARYVYLDSTVSNSVFMNDEQMYRDFHAQQTDLKGLGCPAGRSIVFKDESFRCV